MLPIGWLVAAVVVAILITIWVMVTLTRLDRLHARVDAAQAALDAQLVRRAAALQSLAQHPDSGLSPAFAVECGGIAQSALNADPDQRSESENEVSRAVAALSIQWRGLPADIATELAESSSRVLIARRFYNDAVRDTRTLRARRMPRLLHLAGHRELPRYFDIDDTGLLDVTAEPEGTTA
jgi:hypothetical protein